MESKLFMACSMLSQTLLTLELPGKIFPGCVKSPLGTGHSHLWEKEIEHTYE